MLRGNKPRVQQRKREKNILSLIATVLQHIIKYRGKDRGMPKLRGKRTTRKRQGGSAFVIMTAGCVVLYCSHLSSAAEKSVPSQYFFPCAPLTVVLVFWLQDGVRQFAFGSLQLAGACPTLQSKDDFDQAS